MEKREDEIRFFDLIEKVLPIGNRERQQGKHAAFRAETQIRGKMLVRPYVDRNPLDARAQGVLRKRSPVPETSLVDQPAVLGNDVPINKVLMGGAQIEDGLARHVHGIDEGEPYPPVRAAEAEIQHAFLGGLPAGVLAYLGNGAVAARVFEVLRLGQDGDRPHGCRDRDGRRRCQGPSWHHRQNEQSEKKSKRRQSVPSRQGPLRAATKAWSRLDHRAVLCLHGVSPQWECALRTTRWQHCFFREKGPQVAPTRC